MIFNLETTAAKYKMQPQVRIEYEKTVTRTELVAESNKIWALVRTLQGLGLNQTMEEVRKKHPQFCSSYPIIVRYMVQFTAYSKKAVDNYLKYIEKNQWDSEEKFLVAQSKYVFYLMRALNPKMSPSEVYKIQSNVVDVLRKESSEFKTTVNTAKERADATEESYKKSLREELIKMAKTFPGQFTTMEDKVVLPELPPARTEATAISADDDNASVRADELLE